MSLAEVGFLLDVVDTVGSLALLSALVWAAYRGGAAAPPPPPVAPSVEEVQAAVRKGVAQGVAQGAGQAKRRRF